MTTKHKQIYLFWAIALLALYAPANASQSILSPTKLEADFE